jgi:hypothetical protein
MLNHKSSVGYSKQFCFYSKYNRKTLVGEGGYQNQILLK